jgi:hypothetical protein
MRLPINALRITGSALLIVGYFVMLNANMFWGVSLRLIANAISLPWAMKNKMWDFVTLLGFFMMIELHKFVQMVVGS